MHMENKIQINGLTYDDVLVLPRHSDVHPREVCTKTKLSRHIDLNIPLVSAAMDTVTESRLAIALAHEGGMGFIHKNMSLEEQAEHVNKVKRFQSGMILDPIKVKPNDTLQKVGNYMRDYNIGGVPVVNSENTLVGIITNRDIRFEQDFSRPVSDVMTKKEDLIVTEEPINLNEIEGKLMAGKIEKLPIVDKNYKLKGLITYKDILKSKNKPNACLDEHKRLRVGAALGVTEDIFDRIELLQKVNTDVFVIDTAHGHAKMVLDTAKKVRERFKNIELIAGNVATATGAEALADVGVDAIKVGVGPGSICTTRIVAGIGVPQLSAVMEAADVLAKRGIPIIADGGIRFSGDIVKAIAGGASSIMVGSLFAGTEEAPGDVVFYKGRKFKAYRGMGSVEAMQKGSKDRYFQDVESDIKKLVPEGVGARVSYKGKLDEMVYQLVGGLKAGMGYTGSGDIDTLKTANFVKITQAGMIESHPHDISMAVETSNYSPSGQIS